MDLMDLNHNRVFDVESPFLHGLCYQAAWALSETLGWPIEVLEVDTDIMRNAIVHAWVVAPDGYLVDFGGPWMREWLEERWVLPYVALHERATLRTPRFATAHEFEQRLRADFPLKFNVYMRDDIKALTPPDGELSWDVYWSAVFLPALERARALVGSYVIPVHLADILRPRVVEAVAA